MLSRMLVLGAAALALAAATVGAAAQSPRRAAGVVIQQADALGAQIHRFHAGPGAWRGYTPPPSGYCRILSAGEFLQKELVALANKAIQYGPPGLVLPLQRAADGLSDELDHEEEINNLAGFVFEPNGYPCPAAGSPFAARAGVLIAVNRRMPHCREQANALRLSTAARRALMQKCLRAVATLERTSGS